LAFDFYVPDKDDRRSVIDQSKQRRSAADQLDAQQEMKASLEDRLTP